MCLLEKKFFGMVEWNKFFLRKIFKKNLHFENLMKKNFGHYLKKGKYFIVL